MGSSRAGGPAARPGRHGPAGAAGGASAGGGMRTHGSRGFSPTSCQLLHPCTRIVAPPDRRRHFFWVGAAAFTGAAFAPFFGFFASLPCALLPLAISRTSVGGVGTG